MKDDGSNKAKQIIEYIKRQDKEFEQYDDDLTAIIKYYYYEKLGWCGCGTPADALEAVAEYLQSVTLKEIDERNAYYKDHYGCDRLWNNKLLMCLAYTLDNAGFTDHGSSINWCWLTDDGEYFLWAINQAIKEDCLDLH